MNNHIATGHQYTPIAVQRITGGGTQCHITTIDIDETLVILFCTISRSCIETVIGRDNANISVFDSKDMAFNTFVRFCYGEVTFVDGAGGIRMDAIIRAGN